MRDHVTGPDTAKNFEMFNFETESIGKTRSIVNNVARAMVEKKVLMLGSTGIDTINNANIYDT